METKKAETIFDGLKEFFIALLKSEKETKRGK